MVVGNLLCLVVMVTVLSPSLQDPCDPDFWTRMNPDNGMYGFFDGSGLIYIGNNNVTFRRQYGEFRNGGYLTVYHYQNNSWPKPLLATVIFQYGSNSDRNEVLLSNGCYNSTLGQATVNMTVNPFKKTLSAVVKTKTTEAKVSLPWKFNTSTDTWLQATMRYNWANLVLSLKDTSVNSSTDSNSVSATGEIERSPCALRIGRGYSEEQAFYGGINYVSQYCGWFKNTLFINSQTFTKRV